MLTKFQPTFKSLTALIAITLLLPAISSGLPFFGPKEQPLIFNFDFTINFFQPGEKWPVVKLFKPAEKKAYEQYGRPDAFRILYNQQGDIKIRSVVEQEWKGKKMKTIPSYTWVYSQRNEELVFSGDSFYTQPLTETVRLALTSGDPENVKTLGDGLVEWTYYSTGKIYRIYGNKIVSIKEFPAMGSWNK